MKLFIAIYPHLEDIDIRYLIAEVMDSWAKALEWPWLKRRTSCRRHCSEQISAKAPLATELVEILPQALERRCEAKWAQTILIDKR